MPIRAASAVTENWADAGLIRHLPPMSFAAIPAEVDGFGSGEVSLVGPEVLRELLRAADEDGYLSVALTPPGPGQRADLRQPQVQVMLLGVADRAMQLHGCSYNFVSRVPANRLGRARPEGIWLIVPHVGERVAEYRFSKLNS